MNYTIYRFDQQQGLQVLMTVAKGAGISFEAYNRQINEVLSDVYAEGVFICSTQPIGQAQAVSAVGLIGMNAESALAYLLARCKKRGIWEIFVKGPITKLVGALYSQNLSFVIGPGTMRNSIGGNI